MKRAPETVAILTWLLLWPLVATWLVTQGKTSTMLLCGTLTVATWWWVVRWVERPWGAQAEVWEPVSIAPRIGHLVGYAGAERRPHRSTLGMMWPLQHEVQMAVFGVENANPRDGHESA